MVVIAQHASKSNQISTAHGLEDVANVDVWYIKPRRNVLFV